MDTENLEARRRERVGTAASKKSRRGGTVPAVLYGHKQENIPLGVDTRALEAVLHAGTRVISLKVDGRDEQALIKEVQYDAFHRNILHVDFARVALDERITVEVPIQIHGEPKATRERGVVDQPLHAVQVECLASQIPDLIQLEIADMDIGDARHVRDLPVAADVKVLADPDEVVVVVHPPRKEEEVVVEAAPEEAVTEPEVISEKGKVEEEPEEAPEESS